MNMKREEVINEFLNYMDMHQQAYLASLEGDKDPLAVDFEHKLVESTLTYVQKIAKKYLRSTCVDVSEKSTI